MLKILNIWRRGGLTFLHLCQWQNKHLFHPSIFFCLGSTSAAPSGPAFSLPEKGKKEEGRGLISWTAAGNRAYFLCWLTPIANNTLIENKTCRFEVFRSKTQNYVCMYSFFFICCNGWEVSYLDCKNCIRSCPLSLDKWLPLFLSYLLRSLDLLSLFLNFNMDKDTEILITSSKSKAWK